MFTVQSHKIIPQPLVKVEIQELTGFFFSLMTCTHSQKILSWFYNPINSDVITNP